MALNMASLSVGETRKYNIGGALMYAIIKTGGKQIKVEVGQSIFVEKLDVEAGDKVTFEEQGREKKVVTFRYRRRKDSHRKQGHRQPYTKLTIDAINA